MKLSMGHSRVDTEKVRSEAWKLSTDYTRVMDRYSAVGIATRYGLDIPAIESQWGRDFPHPSRTALAPPSLLYNGYRVFPGGKAARAWR
jgi:hypothetical protein